MGDDITLGRFAAISARLEAGQPRQTVLSEMGLSEAEWLEGQRTWLDELGAQVRAQRFQLLTRFLSLLDEERAALGTSVVGQLQLAAPSPQVLAGAAVPVPPPPQAPPSWSSPAAVSPPDPVGFFTSPLSPPSPPVPGMAGDSSGTPQAGGFFAGESPVAGFVPPAAHPPAPGIAGFPGSPAPPDTSPASPGGFFTSPGGHQAPAAAPPGAHLASVGPSGVGGGPPPASRDPAPPAAYFTAPAGGGPPSPPVVASPQAFFTSTAPGTSPPGVVPPGPTGGGGGTPHDPAAAAPAAYFTSGPAPGPPPSPPVAFFTSGAAASPPEGAPPGGVGAGAGAGPAAYFSSPMAPSAPAGSYGAGQQPQPAAGPGPVAFFTSGAGQAPPPVAAPAPQPVGSAVAPVQLSLEHYAYLTVELERGHDPQLLLARFNLNSMSKYAEDLAWQQRFANDPQEHARFLELLNAYRATPR